MTKQLVMREALDDFGAFKIGQAVLKAGGELVSIAVAPLTVFDHNQGYARVDEASRRLRWIVFATFDSHASLGALDDAIEADA